MPRPAGIGAARQGARTLVVEYLYGLGGVGTLGAISKYYWGNRVGFTQEVVGGRSWDIEQRMEWAAVGVDRFEYAHVTSYENSHATKAQPAYYREILDALGRGPEECLMVGDNWSWDMVNAAEVGIPGYWIAEPSSPPPSAGSMPAGQGSLDDFFDGARSGALEENLAVRTSERLAG